MRKLFLVLAMILFLGCGAAMAGTKGDTGSPTFKGDEMSVVVSDLEIVEVTTDDMDTTLALVGSDTTVVLQVMDLDDVNHNPDLMELATGPPVMSPTDECKEVFPAGIAECALVTNLDDVDNNPGTQDEVTQNFDTLVYTEAVNHLLPWTIGSVDEYASGSSHMGAMACVSFSGHTVVQMEVIDPGLAWTISSVDENAPGSSHEGAFVNDSFNSHAVACADDVEVIDPALAWIGVSSSSDADNTDDTPDDGVGLIVFC